MCVDLRLSRAHKAVRAHSYPGFRPEPSWFRSETDKLTEVDADDIRIAIAGTQETQQHDCSRQFYAGAYMYDIEAANGVIHVLKPNQSLNELRPDRHPATTGLAYRANVEADMVANIELT